MKITDQIGFDSNNNDYLRASALSLMKIIFEYNDVANTNKSLAWEGSVLFPEIEIYRTHIKYQISKKVCEKVLNPGLYEYALIDLNAIKLFKRSASIPIYEQCARFKNIGKTSVIDVDEFKKIVLGSRANEGVYKEYKYFKVKILNQSVDEINKLSDINIDGIIEKKINRSVKSLQFIVSKKADLLLSNKLELIKSIYEEDLKKIGIPDSKIKLILAEYSSEEVEKAIKYTLERMADTNSPPVQKPSAYFIKTLKERYVSDIPVANQTVTKTTIKTESKETKLDEQFKKHLQLKYESAFANETPEEQNTIIATYNMNQPIRNLKINHDKPASEQAKRMFFKWYGVNKFGESTLEEKLAFAQEALENQSRK